MPREFHVTLFHNATDDRWCYRIDLKPGEESYYPLQMGGQDEFGIDNVGPWNQYTQGFLNDICEAISEDVAALFKGGDSFEYDAPDYGAPAAESFADHMLRADELHDHIVRLREALPEIGNCSFCKRNVLVLEEQEQVGTLDELAESIAAAETEMREDHDYDSWEQAYV